MVKLTFFNGTINDSLEIGDQVYYISSADIIEAGVGTAAFTTGDAGSSIEYGTNSEDFGQSTYILIGTLAKIEENATPSAQTIATYLAAGSPQPSAFSLYVIDQPIGFVQPPIDSFIFFAKNNSVQLSSILGYYNKVRFDNNSKKKAELFRISCGFEQSSK